MHEESSHIVLPFEPHRTRFTVSITLAPPLDGALVGIFYTAGRAVFATAARTPLTKRPESSVENLFANSTASSITTAIGTSRREVNSNMARRRMARSRAGMRSIAQPFE